MAQRLGFVGIIMTDRHQCATAVNQILSDYGDAIVARMGLPYHERQCCVMTVIVDISTDQLGAMTGRLGSLQGVTIKSALRKD